MKYAIIDNKGLPTAFYDDRIHSSIPKEAIFITNKQWLECINNQGKRAFIDGVLVEYVNHQKIEETTIKKVIEAKQYLSSTDFKMLPDYEPKENENLIDISLKRKEARHIIRQNHILKENLL